MFKAAGDFLLTILVALLPRLLLPLTATDYDRYSDDERLRGTDDITQAVQNRNERAERPW